MERKYPENAPKFGDGVDVNPYIPKQLRMPTVDTIEGEMRQQVKQGMEDFSWKPGEKIVQPVETYREQIAHLIRLLTYRELMQVAEELNKCDPAGEHPSIPVTIMCQMLDDWAHMVKDENNVGDQNP